jgi:hypothetical protein
MKNFRIFFCLLFVVITVHIDYLIKKEIFKKWLKKLSLHKLKCLS